MDYLVYEKMKHIAMQYQQNLVIFLRSQIASASWTPAGRNFVIIATVLVGASDSTKIGAAAAGQAA